MSDLSLSGRLDSRSPDRSDGLPERPRVLRSRRVVLPDGERPAAVHIADGRITAITAPAEVPADARVIDLGELALLPGVVDSHVHVNEPGRTEWEGFATATRAAAARVAASPRSSICR
jgi:allantoinase